MKNYPVCNKLKLTMSFQIKLKAMKTQEERVEKLQAQADIVLQHSPSSNVKHDVEEFEKKWKITFKKIGI